MDTNTPIFKATPVFYANLKAYTDAKYKHIVNEGSSRSSKSYSLMQLMICIALKESGKRISIVSHSLPHVKRGVLRDFFDIMRNWELFDIESWRATDFIYQFDNRSYIEFIGLDEPDRAKGPGRDILWINEANLVQKQTYYQLAMRTTGTIFADLNPSDFHCYWYDIADNPENKKIHSTYKQNLPNLSKQQIEILESYKDLPDDFMYKVYTLGQRGMSKELIFTKWNIVKEMPGKGQRIYGLDFGYTAPTAFIEVEIHEGQIYLNELIYQTKLTVSDLIDKFKGLNLLRSDEIFADAAEPKSIEEIRRAGYNVKPADKDVWAGIMKLKSMAINITHSSENVKREFQSYKWKVDKDGNIAADEAPVKENDHSIDAIRYAVFTKLSKPQRNWVAF